MKMYKSIYSVGATFSCLPCAYPVLYWSATHLYSRDYARRLLLDLSIESDIVRGCF